MNNLNLIESFMKWKQNKKFIKKLPRLFCDQYRITGEVDQIYQSENGLVLVAFKTSVKESLTWVLQGSAYQYLCKKNGYNVTRIEFVKLSKHGEDAKIYGYKENFEMFLKCLDVYRFFPKYYHEDDYLQYL